ncbi:MAG: bacteriohemerythrin [Candidatus Hadarchaeum sp.]
MAFQWSPSLSVGVSVIDAQHQQLIERVNGLLEAMSNGKGPEEIVRTFDFMANYTVTHFSAEEGYMTRHKYPELDAHKQDHDAFRAEVNRLRQQIATAGATGTLTIQTQRWLTNWLVNHIQGRDKRLGDYLKPRLKTS